MRPLVLAVLFVFACNGKQGPSIPLRLAGTADATLRCHGDDAMNGDVLSTAAITKLRVTIRSRGSDGKTLDFCDRVFDVSGAPPTLEAPAKDATFVDVFVEGFGAADMTDPVAAGGFRRLAYGSLFGVAPTAASFAGLRLFPTSDFRCNASHGQLPRAFHTATLLPDGRVLFVGGLIASMTNTTAIEFPGGGANVTGSAEIYDPRTQTSLVVQETPPTPRAFHAAALLPTSGPCPTGQVAVLLVGGLSAPATAPAALEPSIGGAGGRLVPYGKMGNIPLALSTTAVGNEILCLDGTASPPTATRMAVAGSPAAYRAMTETDKGLLVAGGVTFTMDTSAPYTASTELLQFSQVGTAAQTGATAAARSGATLTAFGTGQALLWGGGGLTDPPGEVVSGFDGATLTTTPAAATGATLTQFHTATNVTLPSDTSATVLVTGGFEIESMGTDAQPPIATNAVRLISVASSMVMQPEAVTFGGGYSGVASCSDAGRYRPAGYESAILLAPGKVLITGGAPSSTTATSHCNDCAGNADPLCASQQASVYDGGMIVSAPPLQVPRFGHTSTLLPDGNVLIAGGIGNQASDSGEAGAIDAVFLDDFEVYDPRAVVPAYNVAVSPIDPDDPIAADLMALSLGRAPGAQATSGASRAAAKSCGKL